MVIQIIYEQLFKNTHTLIQALKQTEIQGDIMNMTQGPMQCASPPENTEYTKHNYSL